MRKTTTAQRMLDLPGIFRSTLKPCVEVHPWPNSFNPSIPTVSHRLADSLLQSYRLRLAMEPAALREPGHRLAPHVVARCRAAETHLLGGGIETGTADPACLLRAKWRSGDCSRITLPQPALHCAGPL